MKKILATLFALVLTLSMVMPVLASENAYDAKSFDIISEVREWGPAITAVIVDVGGEVTQTQVDNMDIKVSAITKLPRDGSEVYNGPRTVTAAYVSKTKDLAEKTASGNYIVLELKHGFNATDPQINGCAGQMYYPPGSPTGYAWTLDLDYTVTIDGKDVPYGSTIKPIVDDFELVSNPVENFTSQKYRMYTPSQSEGKKLPLVLFNHGLGETYQYSATTGRNNEGQTLVAQEAAVTWVTDAPEECYVLLPQRGTGTGAPGYSRPGVIAFINDLIEKGKVDPTRVYISGLSQGGGETHSFLRENPDMFAAAMPICPLSGSSLTVAQLETFKNVPIWYVHGAADTVVPPTNSTTPHGRLVEMGAKDARITVYPSVSTANGNRSSFGEDLPNEEYLGNDGLPLAYYPNGHWSWVMMFNNLFVEDGGIAGSTGKGTTFMDWMFGQKLLKSGEPGVTVTEDPESPGGYTATFVYKSDRTDIAKVEIVNGSFQFYDPQDPVVQNFVASKGSTAGLVRYLPWDYLPGMALSGSLVSFQMDKVSNGVYTFKIPLPANMYEYMYRVTYTDNTNSGNLFDPANPLTGYGRSRFYVGNADTAMPGQEYIYPRDDGKTGTLEWKEYTDYAGNVRRLGVYLPYGYDKDKTYMTIYTSHGSGGSETNWMDIGGVPEIMDNLLAEGSAPEAIVVSMNNTVYSWNHENIRRNMNEAIIPFIEANYSVSKNANDRAFCGLSSGAMTTAGILQRWPEDYRYYGAFSWASYTDPDTWNIEAIRSKKIFVCAGNIDGAYVAVNPTPTSTLVFHELLVDQKVDHKYVIYNGGHYFDLWRESFTNFVKYIKDDKTAPTESALKLTTEAHNVKAGDYFNMNASFKEVQPSNAIVLNYTFDGDLFEYANYTPSNGVTIVDTEYGDGTAKITLMVPNYAAENLGDIMLRAKVDAKLKMESQKVSVAAEYVVKDEAGNKEINFAETAASFTTLGDGSGEPVVPGDTDNNGVVDILDLSNMIDWFEIDNTHSNWHTLYTFFDFNNNGKIDISDIAYVARLIK